MRAIVLFGSPGSGKGTQAKFLTECLRVPHVSTGDMLRDRIRSGSELGTAVVATMHSGGLVSDQVVNLMVEERLSKPDAAKGFVLDGYPRTLAQAEHLCRWLDGRGVREVVIHLAVDYNVIIGRLTGRRECPRCGTLYNVAFHPPKMDELCDLDGEKLAIRDDDREPVIRERLDAYGHQTRPVLEYYRTVGRRVVEVEASDDPPPIVFQKICQAMEKDDRSKDSR
ncbi:MAG: nucleoside monophosphate kinase [Acidobacteriia bacterium]|nr:nucleoside monophosphate kinase [Terriglobia bacterium]